MSASFDLESPTRVTVGAVGPPGKRVFYFQARQDDQLVSLKLEKEQVLFLAGGLTEVMADLAAPGPVPSESELELEEPVLAEWAVGSMQLGYDSTTDRVLLVAREVVPDGAEDAEAEGPGTGPAPAGEAGRTSEEALARDVPTEGWSEVDGDDLVDEDAAVVRVALTREQAAGVIEHGKRLLRKGRPPCPLCGFPLGEDHSCPKTNGHRAPAL